MANQKLNTESLEKMIYEVLENTKKEIINRKGDAKIYDSNNALRILNELSIYLPQTLDAVDIPGNTICYHTTPTGWKLKIDATVDLKIDEQGCIIGEKCDNIKYFMIYIKNKSHNQNDNIINELNIFTEYRYVNYPPLDGCTTLPEALDSEISKAGNDSTFTFDKSNRILKYSAEMNFYEGIHVICNWERPNDEL